MEIAIKILFSLLCFEINIRSNGEEKCYIMELNRKAGYMCSLFTVFAARPLIPFGHQTLPAQASTACTTMLYEFQ